MPSSDNNSLTASRRVAIAGASGLVGQSILKGLLADESVSEVHALCRRNLSIKHPKLFVQCVDFNHLPILPPLDELYLAIGTTIKDAGSQEAFRAVDFMANLAVAKSALVAGVKRIALVSAMGADVHSKVFYNRIKGELEEALIALNAEGLLIARPSLLVGDRKALGQASRPLEKFSMALFQWLGFIMPRSLRPILAQNVATALLCKLPSTHGVTLLSSHELQAFTEETLRDQPSM